MTSEPDTTQIEAAVFRRLVTHLQTHPDIQNMELMLLARFCRNCLGKWYHEAATEAGLDMDYPEALQAVYGMPYETWKQQYQQPATPEQMAQFKAMQSENGA